MHSNFVASFPLRHNIVISVYLPPTKFEVCRLRGNKTGRVYPYPFYYVRKYENSSLEFGASEPSAEPVCFWHTCHKKQTAESRRWRAQQDNLFGRKLKRIDLFQSLLFISVQKIAPYKLRAYIKRQGISLSFYL